MAFAVINFHSPAIASLERYNTYSPPVDAASAACGGSNVPTASPLLEHLLDIHSNGCCCSFVVVLAGVSSSPLNKRHLNKRQFLLSAYNNVSVYHRPSHVFVIRCKKPLGCFVTIFLSFIVVSRCLRRYCANLMQDTSDLL